MHCPIDLNRWLVGRSRVPAKFWQQMFPKGFLRSDPDGKWWFIDHSVHRQSFWNSAAEARLELAAEGVDVDTDAVPYAILMDDEPGREGKKLYWRPE